jgi:Na+/phosphate symporter
MIISTAGGLGLFLLGRIVMTEGLRELAGDAIRSALVRFTSSPASGAVLLITPYIADWQYFQPDALAAHAEIALVTFHTLFNVLGVLLVLPFTDLFARLIRRLVPERITPYALEFDRRLLSTPALALTVIQETLLVQFVLLLNHVDAIVNTGREEKRTDPARAQTALDETQIPGCHSLQGRCRHRLGTHAGPGACARSHAAVARALRGR